MEGESFVHAASLASRVPSSARDRLILATSTVIVAALLIAAGLFVYHAVAPTTTFTAYFSETIGVYPGSTVRILGVPVGTVNSVTPDGTRVKVTMTLNSGVPVPANHTPQFAPTPEPTIRFGVEAMTLAVLNVMSP